MSYVWTDDPRAEMAKFVPDGARRILEFGCGYGAFGAFLKRTRGLEVTGVEPVAQAAERAASRLDRVLVTTIDHALKELQDSSYDCVVFNDVLEHLADPWGTLRRARSVLSSAGVVVASLPNVRFFPVITDLLLRKNWEYTETGVLDRTHLRFFTMRTVRSLFEDAQYTVVALEGINASRSLRFAIANLALLGSIEDMRYQQFAVLAKPEPVE